VIAVLSDIEQRSIHPLTFDSSGESSAMI